MAEHGRPRLARRGLFYGFDAYRTPSDDDFRSVFATGIVVPDTNVLLDLYRYSPEARDSLLDVLTKLGDRLWVPHQVVTEFWTSRDGVLRDPRGTAELTAELKKLRDRAAHLLELWAKGRSLAPEDSEDLLAHVEEGFSRAVARVAEFDDGAGGDYLRDSSGDPVVTSLAPILDGRVGEAPGPELREQWVREGLDRVSKEIPPGYKDRTKTDDGAAGDFIVWKQLLAEAQDRECDALFVTSDVKEDWWRRVRDEPRGPRPELVREMATVVGRRLLMVQPDGLLERARALLNVDVPLSSLENVERVQQIEVEKQRDDGWTAQAVSVVMGRLADEAPAQAEVVQRAAELGGFIDRAEVYSIAGFDPGRSLRGFTRPVRRITQMFQDRGLISAVVSDLLEAKYDDQAGVATGFTVPRSVISLILDSADPSETSM
jgi:hypothetical protein